MFLFNFPLTGSQTTSRISRLLIHPDSPLLAAFLSFFCVCVCVCLLHLGVLEPYVLVGNIEHIETAVDLGHTCNVQLHLNLPVRVSRVR